MSREYSENILVQNNAGNVLHNELGWDVVFAYNKDCQFPELFVPYAAGINADSSFDKQIYALANQCATNYIDSNNNSDEEDVRLRILFLKKLLFTARYINDSLFIQSGELIRMLSNNSEQKVTREYLYRRIVAWMHPFLRYIASEENEA